MILIKFILIQSFAIQAHLFAMSRCELICYCSSVTEEEISEAITAGARTLGALRQELGVSTCCGGCEPRLRNCLQDAELQRPGMRHPLPGVPHVPQKSSITSS